MNESIFYFFVEKMKRYQNNSISCPAYKNFDDFYFLLNAFPPRSFYYEEMPITVNLFCAIAYRLC